eukprot:CAMPEP_0175238906 /NCGR_PEP_ID=MMETSP0093-20121207/29273_1 /TAXON_ID=311494 /ORGANISM="Alexandrium monilatum, Strain CCMP3105" /LENGTH=124 /DNA_ID=CAMNT_0016532923 /DNA_START=108 /DNA_END=484 /DNA_ORIENTATION=-
MRSRASVVSDKQKSRAQPYAVKADGKDRATPIMIMPMALSKLVAFPTSAAQTPAATRRSGTRLSTDVAATSVLLHDAIPPHVARKDNQEHRDEEVDAQQRNEQDPDDADRHQESLHAVEQRCDR